MKLPQPPPFPPAHYNQANQECGEDETGAFPGKVCEAEGNGCSSKEVSTKWATSNRLIEHPKGQRRHQLTLREVESVLRPSDV